MPSSPMSNKSWGRPLKPGDIVVLDNLGAHKVPGIHEAIEAAGAKLLYLPPYSPDFNPIENSSPNLKRCSARPPSARSRASGTASHDFSMSSSQMNVPTTSATPDIRKLSGNCSSGPVGSLRRAAVHHRGDEAIGTFLPRNLEMECFMLLVTFPILGLFF